MASDHHLGAPVLFPASPSAPGERLPSWARWGLSLLVVLFALYALHVWHRSLLLKRRMTDLGVYARAAWAARTGANLYEVTDTNGCHYVYPPLFALVMAPLAEAPPGVEGSAAVPFAVSVLVWYAFSVVCAFWASHWLAGALEQRTSELGLPRQPPGSPRWWALRLLPLLICLPTILATLVHGQVNLLLLALVCGMIGALLRGRSWLAGLFLSGAICLKVFPAFLLLHALWRRDARCLGGCALGLGLGLVALPVAAWGPQRALYYHQQFADKVLWPGLGLGTDQTMAQELTNITATDSQSFLAILHNSLHLDPATRPPQASPLIRLIAMLGGGLLTALTLWAAGWQGSRSAPPNALSPPPLSPPYEGGEGGGRERGNELLLFGLLVVDMLLLCPVCHRPYFCLLLPLVMAVVVRSGILAGPRALDGRGPGRIKVGLLTLWFSADVIAHTLPHVPGLSLLRDLGLATYAVLVFWLVGWALLWRGTRDEGRGANSTALDRR